MPYKIVNVKYKEFGARDRYEPIYTFFNESWHISLVLLNDTTIEFKL